MQELGSSQKNDWSKMCLVLSKPGEWRPKRGLTAHSLFFFFPLNFPLVPYSVRSTVGPSIAPEE